MGWLSPHYSYPCPPFQEGALGFDTPAVTRNQINGRCRSVLRANLLADFFGAFFVRRVTQQLFQLLRDTPGLVVGPRNRTGHAEAPDASGVVRLVVVIRHDEHGNTRTKALSRRAYAALVDHQGGAR